MISGHTFDWHIMDGARCSAGSVGAGLDALAGNRGGQGTARPASRADELCEVT